MSKVIYNVTISVSEEPHERWLDWMKREHIPEVLKTGCFEWAKLLRVHAFEQGGLTYAVMYCCSSMAQHDSYILEHSARLQAQHEALFKESVVAFRTTLEVLQEFSAPID